MPGRYFGLLHKYRVSKWSERTQEICLYALKGWAKWAYGNDHPIRKAKIHVPQPDPMDHLTLEQINLLLNSIDRNTDKGKRNFAHLRLMLESGLRASEVGRISVKSVDLDRKRLNVLQKQARIRNVIFGDQVKEAILNWLPVRAKYAKCDSLFISLSRAKPGARLSRAGVYIAVRKMGEDVDIKLSPHMLRYTFAVQMLKAGVSTKAVAALGGWQHLKMVER